MHAQFENTSQELRAVAIGAGLDLGAGLTILSCGEVRGAPHAIMQLIGALADDGQDTLIRTKREVDDVLHRLPKE